jgi:hypothetical protein
MKANISLIINKTTPIDKPFCTSKVCEPKKVASDIMSLNHKIEANEVRVNPKVKK